MNKKNMTLKDKVTRLETLLVFAKNRMEKAKTLNGRFNCMFRHFKLVQNLDQTDVKHLVTDNRGFTLLECMAAAAILSIILYGFLGIVKMQVKLSKNISKKLETSASLLTDANTVINNNPALAPGADQRTYLPVLNKCVKINGADTVVNGVVTVQWYGKRIDSRSIYFYKNSISCITGGIGTLTAQTNPTYDDDVTNTFWNVSGQDSSLRIWVHRLNLPKP